MEFGILLRLADEMNLIFVYIVPSLFKGENHTYVIGLKTTKDFENWLEFNHLQTDFFSNLV